MPRMIDLIRRSQFPSNLMHAAARGALAVPPGEMMEILVHLALHNKVFGEQARMTLAGWDERASQGVAADPRTSTEVLGYFIERKNLRPALLPMLLGNPSVSIEQLMELAQRGSREVVQTMLASERVKSSPTLLSALRENPSLRENETAELHMRLQPLEGKAAPAESAGTETTTTAEHSQSGDTASVGATDVDEETADEHLLLEAIEHYLKENEHELAHEAEKPFEPVRVIGLEGVDDEAETAEIVAPAAQQAAGAIPAAGAQQAAPAAPKIKKLAPPADERRDSTLRKISKLDIKGRIALAMRGNKEERSILIRDGTKLVALAVLDSPKISDGEVEKIALQKNVLEAVLRAIPLKRRFAKNYAITRNLVYNPRTPLDLSLGLMKNLLVHDLKNLAGNKEVSDTIRKLALRMFKQKAENKK